MAFSHGAIVHLPVELGHDGLVGCFRSFPQGQTIGGFTQEGRRDAGVKMMPNRENQKNGPVRFWSRIKILMPHYLCENSK